MSDHLQEAREFAEWVARLASLVNALRPDWDEHDVRSVLAKVADRPLIDVASAAVAACRRIDQRTPSIIAASGSHWPDASNSQRTYTESGIVTWCAHGRPGALHCPDCTPVADRATPDRIAEIRRAARECVMTPDPTAPLPEPWDAALVGVVSDALAGTEDPGPHWDDDARRVLDALAARGYLERPKAGV